MKNKNLVIVAVLAVIVLVGMGFLYIKIKNRATKQAAVETTADWQAFESADCSFKLKYPKDWTADTPAPVTSTFKECVLIKGPGERTYFSVNQVVKPTTPAVPTSVDILKLLNITPDPKADGKPPTTDRVIGKRKGKFYTFTDRDFVYNGYLISKKDIYYNAVWPQSVTEDEEKIIEKILDSMEFSVPNATTEKSTQ